MIYDISRRLRNRFHIKIKHDMFRRTQNRLTILYSSMLIFFLLLFIVIVYSVFYLIITAEQKQEVQTLANQELAIYQDLMKYNSKDHDQPIDVQKSFQEANEGQFFYYVVTTDGRLVTGNERISSLRSNLLKKVRGWIPQTDEVRYETVKLPHEHEIHLLMAGRAIYNNGHLIGTLYTGKDITFYRYMFNMLLLVLIGLSLLFLIIATITGYLMSRKAMIPIMRGYDRQREFVADASHELRTPLSVLYSSLEVIEAEEQDNISNFSHEVLKDMKDEVKRMTKLVNDLLTLARSDSEGLNLLYEIFDVVSMAKKLVRSFQPLADSRQMKLVVKAPETLMMEGDQERIKQLLFILLDNAIKYSLDGGKVTVSLQEVTKQKKAMLCLKVQDEGIGIPLEHQKRIFDRFFRADKDRSRQTGGTGLGLSIAKWITEAHQGRIDVFSTVGLGSTFTVWMPLGDLKNKQ